MNTRKEKWNPVDFDFSESLKRSIGQQHSATQLLALTGRYLLAQQPDLSNIAMQFNLETGRIEGNFIHSKIKVALDLRRLKICFIDGNKTLIDAFELEGKRFSDAFSELKRTLQKQGIETDKLELFQPYPLPSEGLTNNRFQELDFVTLEQSARLRANAQQILEAIKNRFEVVQPVRIWPHHFDTGSFISVTENEKGEATKTVGFGWAIPDSMINEPYFYTSFWSDSELPKKFAAAPLAKGEWKVPDWNGAVLAHSTLRNIPPENQYNSLENYFDESISSIQQFLKSGL